MVSIDMAGGFFVFGVGLLKDPIVFECAKQAMRVRGAGGG